MGAKPSDSPPRSEADIPSDNTSDAVNTVIKSNENVTKAEEKYNRSKHFWAIIITLAITGLLRAHEKTVVTIALPYIVRQLDLGENYIWVTSAFFLTGYDYQSSSPAYDSRSI